MDPAIEKKIKKFLVGKNRTLVEVADLINASPKETTKLLAQLKRGGHNVSLVTEGVTIETDLPVGNHLVVDSKNFYDGEWYKFGTLGDTHLYSKYARLDVLNCLYDIYEKEGIKTVFHAGNIIDGEFRFNKFDLIGPSGTGPQIDYLISEYPKRQGIVTQFITGDDHEGWAINREGINIGQMIEAAAINAGREDLQWIGHMEADIKFRQPKGDAWMKVIHPGGGSAYAISYTEQKISEAFQGGEKPRIMLLGHYHKFNYGYSREIHSVQTGCCQDQTPFMRKNKLQAHVGGCIIRFHQALTGEINRFQVEWIPFYDRGFYEKKNRYRRW
jgi:predicted phosphodiesterase